MGLSKAPEARDRDVEEILVAVSDGISNLARRIKARHIAKICGSDFYVHLDLSPSISRLRWCVTERRTGRIALRCQFESESEDRLLALFEQIGPGDFSRTIAKVESVDHYPVLN